MGREGTEGTEPAEHEETAHRRDGSRAGAASSKLLLRIGAVFVAGLLLFFALRPEAVPVEVGRVSRGPLRVTVDNEGETRVRDRFVIAAPVAGRLQRIVLDPGDAVEPGQVVARMNPLPLDPRAYAEAAARREAAEAAEREAAARVEQARAAVEQAKREADRARKLERGGTISKGELERADLDLTTREKELEASLFASRAAEFNVAAARAATMASGPTRDGAAGLLELVSPVQGTVLRVLEESERTVGFGTPLLEIGDPSSLEVVVDVLTSDAVKIRPGAPILLEEWGGDEPIGARVRLVEPSAFTKVSALGVEEQRVNVVADLDDGGPPLGDGYRLEARIIVWEGEDVVQVPASAVFRHRGAWSVFAVEGGVARRRTVELAHGSPLAFEVVSGIAEGDTVILHPSDLVDDGVRVAFAPPA